MKKMAIITGDSKGLGKSLVKTFLEDSYEVVGISRGQIENCRHRHFSNDLLDIKKTLSLLDSIGLEEFQDISLIHNAALLAPMGKLSFDRIDDLEKHIKLNLTTPLAINTWFIDILKERDMSKQIIHISSGASANPYPGWLAYCSSKAGLRMATQVLVEEEKYKKFPVLTWDYNPGVMETEMQDLIRSYDEREFPRVKKFIDLKTQGELKDTESVARDLVNKIKANQKQGSFISFGE